MAETHPNGEGATPRRRSPLAAELSPGDYGALGPEGPRVFFSERPGLSTVQVEADAETGAHVLDLLRQGLGRRPPERPNTSLGGDDLRLIWAGPWRWHVVEPEHRDLEAFLFEATAGSGAAVVDLSSSRAVFRLAGHEARYVLAKGSGLDLHPKVFTAGSSAQTALFHIDVLIDCLDDEPTFDIYAARGFALSLWQSLCHAGAEYGYRVQ